MVNDKNKLIFDLYVMTFKIKNRHRLKRKEIKEIINELSDSFSECFFDEKSSVEKGDFEEFILIFVDNIPCFVIFNDKIIFTLFGIYKYKPKEKFVVVDMGAVKFVTSGADVMSPGIVDADEGIVEGDQVWICDERNHKPLAVGIALINGEKMVKETTGKSVKIINFVGDKLWKAFCQYI